ncbi:hypothetical protein HWV62_16626 [Athelia sp. TMB]|nr:hypothetical protein HWV62_16626 [Athelia sp. TMB]
MPICRDLGTKEASAFITQEAALKSSTFNLCQNGVVRQEVRQMARALVKAGCGQNHVYAVIRQISAGIGITVTGKVSRRTVGRSILEGGVAAEVQLAHEIKHTESELNAINQSLDLTSVMLGLTASSDGTSEKHINYESQHIAFKNPNSQKIATHVLRVFNVMSSVDHTSETQVEGWKNRINSLADLFNCSPLAQRHNQSLFSPEFARKLKGMNGDHAADQKKTFSLMGAWKRRMTLLDLGSSKLQSAPVPEIVELVNLAHAAKIADAGGAEAWEQLSEADQEAQNISMMEDLAISLGGEAFDQLPEPEKRELEMFLRAGCCMHKELNSVKGGAAAMADWWTDNNVPGPVLLANRNNAAVLDSIPVGEDAVTAAELRALDVSGAGGIKATSLAGAIFNHKDAKKGQQDSHRIFFQEIKDGHSTKFPSTSNTRYQSHCQAAAELLAYLKHYKEFLLAIKDRKEKRRLNHMEHNLQSALHDVATITELSVLALYGIFVTEPYINYVRGGGLTEVNILKLGPFHHNLIDHIKTLIATPDLLLTPETADSAEFLGQSTWRKSRAVAEIHSICSSLPHLRSLLCAFLTGTLTTWERFCEEFNEDGDIAQLSESARESAWMPATNDINEGTLGKVVRINRRDKPTQTMHQNVAQVMYMRNETQEFVEEHFTEADYTFCRREARLRDASQLEAKRLTEIREHDEAVVASKRARDQAREDVAAQNRARIAAATNKLISTIADLPKMTCSQLDEQLEIFRQWDTSIRAKSYYGKKAEKVAAVTAAFKRYEERGRTTGGGITQ